MDHHDSPAMRFAPYVVEVRDHLRARDMPVGSPEALSLFADRLGRDTAFREEMGSLLRSIAYREEQHIGATELAWIQCWSTANTEPDQLPTTYDPTLKTLLTFGLEALRPLRAGTASIQDASAFGELSAQPAIHPAGTAAAVPSGVPEFPSSATPISIATTTTRSSTEDLQSTPQTNDRLSRALYQNATELEPLEPVEPAFTTSLADPPPERLQPRPASTAASARHAEPRTFMSVLRRSYWIPGVCLLIIAVALAEFLTKPGSSHGASAAPAADTAPSSLAAPSSEPAHENKAQVSTRAALAPPSPSTNPEAPKVTSTKGLRHSPPNARATPALPARPRPEHKSHTVPVTAEPAAEARATGDRSASDAREGVFLASSGMMTGHLMSAPAPSYPRLASFTHVEGQVVLQVVVNRDGTVSATHVLDGPRLLRGAAEHAVRRWRYRPYVVEGRATVVATIVTMSFRLRH